jgi:zinc/manganese transport system substrate-binding protein
VRRLNPWAVGAMAGILAMGGCGLPPGATAAPTGVIEVVAAENFWGSIASQVGGAHAHVTSVVTNPAIDPHAYEPRPADARGVASAHYVIANGAGYDPWVTRLLDANPVSGRRVLVVADLVGRHPGENPHFWYSPAYVDSVVDQVAADLGRLDPADQQYFSRRGLDYKSSGLAEYRAAIATIRARYAGTAVGATESIFAYAAEALGLRLLTPGGFMKAVATGGDPTASDKAEVQQQVSSGQIRVLVFNPQNSTPDVSAYVGLAHAHAVPVVAMTETLQPATSSFQSWQTSQLRQLLQALGG